MKHTLLGWLLALAALFAASGCGGGGDGGLGGSAPLNIFLTDDLGEHESVWVRIHSVHLATSGGEVRVFNSQEGHVVDLRSLRDEQGGRFAFLTRSGIAPGVYTGARVALGQDVTLVTPGATGGLARQFAGVVAGRKQIALDFANPRQIGAGGGNLVLDFDLSQWTDDGTHVQNAVVREENDLNLSDAARHERMTYRGSVVSLGGAAPHQTFGLWSDDRTVQVQVHPETVVFNKSGLPNASLANGRNVEVFGTFSPAANALVARSIAVRDQLGGEGEASARGPVVSVGPDHFTVRIARARGFLPSQADLKVAYTSTTRYFLNSGLSVPASEFFSRLGEGVVVQAEGQYSAGNHTMTAVKVKLEDGAGTEAEVEGPTHAIDASAGSFRIAATRWQGLNIGMGQPVAVQTSGATSFANAAGESITSGQFFAALGTGGARADAKGSVTFVGNQATIAAVRVRLKSGAGGHGEVGGPVVTFNVQARTLTMSARTWDGLSLVNGQVIQVNTTGATLYRNDDGESISQAQFFAALTQGHLIEAEGTLVGATLTASKLKLDDD
jgi:hypothetical protein